MRPSKAIIGLIVLLNGNQLFAAGESVGVEAMTPGQLIAAATRGEGFPPQPRLPMEMRGLAANEIDEHAQVRQAYEKIAAANQKGGADVHAVAALVEHRALWCLLSCLASPNEDNQIVALRGLEELGDRRAVPFLLIFAEYMTFQESGSENATIHDIVQASTAKTLSTLTGVTESASGPGDLKRGIRKWRKWLAEQESDNG